MLPVTMEAAGLGTVHYPQTPDAYFLVRESTPRPPRLLDRAKDRVTILPASPRTLSPSISSA